MEYTIKGSALVPCLIISFIFWLLFSAIAPPGQVVYRCGMYSYVTVSHQRFDTFEEAKTAMIQDMDEKLKWKNVND